MDLLSHPLQVEVMHGEMLLWDLSPEPFDPTTIPITPSPLAPPPAFTRYVSREALRPSTINGRKNIHHRVIELVRRIPTDRPESRAAEQSRGFLHMMRERQRRERLSQSYADLYSMLPCRSKADKNSIVQSAAAYVRELKGVRDELRRRGEELKVRSACEGSKIRIAVANPAAAIDSMIGALRSLKAMDVKARAVHAEFSGHELTAIMSVETKVGATEVERAVMESCR